MAEKSAEPEEDHASLDDKSKWSAPGISLPKDGGAIRGIGEKFNADPTTGAAANPAANTTDALTADHIHSFEPVGGVAKDLVSLTPPGAVTMLIWTVMQPRGEFYYDEGLAQRAIAQGRNPFCAQCHSEGGALDPNNPWNRRAEQKRFEGVLKLMPPMQMDDEAIRQYIQQIQ